MERPVSAGYICVTKSGAIKQRKKETLWQTQYYTKQTPGAMQTMAG